MSRQRADNPDVPTNTGADPALQALAAAPPGSLLLHSGRSHPRWSRHSLLATPQAWFRYTADHQSHLTHAQSGEPLAPPLPLTHNLWTDLRNLLNSPTFPGRWFGYLSYDLAPLIEPGKLHPPAPSDWPLVELAWCPEVTEFPTSNLESEISNLKSPLPAPPSPGMSPRIPGVSSNLTRDQYESAVRRALDYIAAGDIFQVNLAQQFTTDYHADPRTLFTRLATISPAWYGAFLEFPPSPGMRSSESPGYPRAICSTSPELFLELRNSHVITRPIKGTRPASHPNPKDARHGHFSAYEESDPNLAELTHSAKDQAELNMIVDLMRNDLGRVCSYGSVRVTAPRDIESHPTVHHGVATIQGELHPSKDLIDLLRATLPGGSVTGAPKVRAMQIIAELEPTPRGTYCGAIGYLSKDEACLSIAIRTILLTPEPGDESANPRCNSVPNYLAQFSVGAGIVADSDPAAEYDETLAKARAMMQALAVAGNV